MHNDRVDEQLQNEEMDLNNCEGVFQNGVNGYSEEENSFSLRKIVV